MRRWLSLTVVLLALFAIVILSEAASRSTSANARRARVQGALTVRVVPFGPTQATIDATSNDLSKRPQVQALLKGSRHRLLSFELIEPDEKLIRRTEPNRYRATFYDYTRNRAVVAEGSFERPDEVEASVVDSQPLPSREEFDAAVEILQQHPTIGPALRSKSLIPYPPMPPLVNEDGGSRVERTLAVGLLPGSSSGDARLKGVAAAAHEIVGVNMIRQMAIRFRGGAPRTSAVGVFACGVANAGQATTARGTAGQYQLTVSQGATELWNLLVVRPSVSSGTRGSGVELRSVFYRGKSVLKRAHVPILNVKYDNNLCGPYRDWQYQEGMFVADGSDVAPGIRTTVTQPQTVLDNLTDTGNFRGVAIYATADSVQLVSEMEAGWYRYISEWHLLSNGTIQPRFGFGGTQNGCVCNTHHHHAFWRFDFDVAGTNNIVAEESASLSLKEWTVRYFFGTEAKRIRNADNPRRWIVRNTTTGEGYIVLPGKEDGYANTYARGDVWVLFFRSTELDDGRNSTSTNTEADLDKFVNGESVEGKDVVLWYRGGFDHSPESNESHPPRHSEGPEVVGPDLIPSNW